MIIKIIMIMILFNIEVNAETYRYLIYASNFPQDRYRTSVSTINPTYRRFDSVGKKTINEVGGQPFRITNYEKNSTGKYAILNITPSETESGQLASMVRQGYIKLLSVHDVVSKYDASRGGYITEFQEEKYDILPDDFYDVVVSSSQETQK